MRKFLTTLVAAVTIGAATLAMSSSANAWRGGGWGWGWGLGGFAVGALIGSALAAPYYYPYGYYTTATTATATTATTATPTTATPTTATPHPPITDLVTMAAGVHGTGGRGSLPATDRPVAFVHGAK
jgi:hypothetical protein